MSENYNEEERSGDILDSKDLEGPTGQKDINASSRYQKQQDLKKSHIQGQEKDQQENILDKLEGRIREIEEELKEVHLQGVKVGKKDFARRRELETLRSNLRKELIDVAHNHKQILIDKQERDYERVRVEEEQKIRQLEQDVRKLRESRRQKSEKKEQDVEQKVEQREKQGVENLSESRRKARISELQAELTADDLRNSRRALIDYELAALKLSYYPYRSYSSIYPSYSRYSYLSPYAYSHYI